MSEQSNTEPDEQLDQQSDQQPTPDESTFDITAWLAKGDAGRARETVTVYNDIGLVDEAARLHRELETAKRKQDEGQAEDLAVGERSELGELQARYDEIDAQVQAAKGEIVIVSLSPSEAEALVAEYKKTFGDKADIDGEARGTFWRLSRAATFNGQKLTADQWEAVSENIAGGQWQSVVQASMLAQTKRPRVDSPFSRGGSRLSPAVRAS